MINAEDQKIEVQCLEVTQPIGTFYIGVMKHEDLVKISYADIRRLEVAKASMSECVFSFKRRMNIIPKYK